MTGMAAFFRRYLVAATSQHPSTPTSIDANTDGHETANSLYQHTQHGNMGNSRLPVACRPASHVLHDDFLSSNESLSQRSLALLALSRCHEYLRDSECHVDIRQHNLDYRLRCLLRRLSFDFLRWHTDLEALDEFVEVHSHRKAGLANLECLEHTRTAKLARDIGRLEDVRYLDAIITIEL